jgi:S1-C subfamily serine protease
VEVASSDSAAAGSGFGSVGSSGTGSAAGATISGVVSGGPAESAGLAAGDTITAVNGTTIDSAQALTAALAALHPGDSATIAWTDASGASHTAQVTLAQGPVA